MHGKYNICPICKSHECGNDPSFLLPPETIKSPIDDIIETIESLPRRIRSFFRPPAGKWDEFEIPFSREVISLFDSLTPMVGDMPLEQAIDSLSEEEMEQLDVRLRDAGLSIPLPGQLVEENSGLPIDGIEIETEYNYTFNGERVGF